MLFEVVSTAPEKCKQCYSCVRNCPVKAVKIKNGQAVVIQSRCINCGYCAKFCYQDAKRFYDGSENVKQILKRSKYPIAILAPSYRVAFSSYHPMKISAALKKIGFKGVWEVAVGADIVASITKKYLEENPNKKHLSSACPAFVNLIEKHYPELIPNLLPIVSPMVATAKLIKFLHQNEDIKIVFIGPCIAKKGEIREDGIFGIIDEVLTFEELKKLFKGYEIDLNKIDEKRFDSPKPGIGSIFALSGSYSMGMKFDTSVLGDRYISVEGKDNCIDIVKTIINNRDFDFEFVDALFCQGCISGIGIDNGLSYYQKKQVLLNYSKFDDIKYNNSIDINIYMDNLNLLRDFTDKQNITVLPSQQEICEILKMTGKYTKEDELNCGACGYTSCREKAIAVYNGVAEAEMCLPYLISEKNKLLDEISEELKNISTLNDELDDIIESSYDGLLVINRDGEILRANTAFMRLVGIDKLPGDIKKLEDDKIIYPVSSLLAIKEKRRISVLQESAMGRKFLATSNPIYDDMGNLIRIVVNLRDINELIKLKVQFEEYEYRQQIKPKKLAKLSEDNIVVNSREFGEVLNTAANVAKVDSTVLILGESGVGKEIVAKFIHNVSPRSKKPFIALNCGSIPETLIESELFGYETGAFTGAKREGKKGLFELADKGTLFLDEIGDLPFLMQVKLLKVIQEKQIMRIGGTKFTDVDVRIIAATNRDLKKMVKDGLFRADLYYRLNVVPVTVPPLRVRKDDILPLAYHFLEKYNKKYGLKKVFNRDIEHVLLSYDWPGNVRELENIVERLVVTVKNDVININDVPEYIYDLNTASMGITINNIMPLKNAVDEVEKQLIVKTYELYKNTYKIAEILGVNQSTVVRKIKKYLKDNA